MKILLPRPAGDGVKKILIIDDSAIVRKQLREIFEQAGYSVAIARNGRDGLVQAERVMPDLVTLDVNMPEMGGLECLQALLEKRPLPVIMVSSLMTEGAEAALSALHLGAVDILCKPDGSHSRNMAAVTAELLAKVEAALLARVSPRRRSRPKPARPDRTIGEAPPGPRPRSPARSNFPVVLIGSSTGGPRCLQEILEHLPTDFPAAVIVAQHMPATFTKVFARRLAKEVAIPVMETQQRTELAPGHCYIGRGDADCVVSRSGGRHFIAPVPPREGALWRPSVDRMVESALANIPSERLFGTLLTGMGWDGAEAFSQLRGRNRPVIAESETSCVVFGMPRRLIERGGASAILDSSEIGPAIIDLVAPVTAHGAQR